LLSTDNTDFADNQIGIAMTSNTGRRLAHEVDVVSNHFRPRFISVIRVIRGRS